MKKVRVINPNNSIFSGYRSKYSTDVLYGNKKYPFSQFLKDKIGEKWYLSQQAVKRLDQAGSKRINYKQYRALEDEYVFAYARKNPATQRADLKKNINDFFKLLDKASMEDILTSPFTIALSLVNSAIKKANEILKNAMKDI